MKINQQYPIKGFVDRYESRIKVYISSQDGSCTNIKEIKVPEQYVSETLAVNASVPFIEELLKQNNYELKMVKVIVNKIFLPVYNIVD